MKVNISKFSGINLSLSLIISLLVSVPLQVAVAPKAESATTSICSGNGVRGDNSANGFTVYKYELTTAANNAGTNCASTFTVPTGVTQVEFLLVSGGGGGGHDGGGGGGGGGVLYYKNWNVTPGAVLNLTIGAGGAPAGSSCSGGDCPEGGTGNSSIFDDQLTQGGGGGGGRYSNGVASQGSGGGAGHDNDSSISRSGGDSTGDSDPFYVTYGNDGGANSNTYGGGGGGSATNTGSNTGGVGVAGGNGGNGFYSQIESSAGAYYGGGGGGGTFTGDPRTSGGLGGGGQGGNSGASGVAGTNSLGGGGGGGGNAGQSAGRGGGGVIIIRFQDSCSISTATTYNTGVGSNTKNLVRITSSNTASSCTGSWTVPSNVTSVEVFVLAGGGGGGGKLGAGGGSGGAINNTSYSVTAGSSISISVGGGGRGGYGSWNNSASKGGDSIFGSLTALGGGAGGDEYDNGISGGSGGGAGGGGGSPTTYGTATQASGTGTKYGSNGGNQSTSGGGYGAGGGGGLGGAGGNGTSSSGGAGGIGISIYGYSLGGGGGGGVNDGSAGTAITFGGGAGSNSGNGANGTAATGGGGGGGRNNSSTFGGDGGSGVIIILYAVNLTLTFNSNYGTPTTSTQTIPSNTSTNLTANSFSRSGYRFASWNTQSNGSGTSYLNSAAISISTNTTLYAQWTFSAPTLSSVTVTGTALSGSVITATPSASGEGTISYSYQWYRIISGVGISEISNATSSTYTLTDSELLGYVYVSVIASSEYGSSSAVIGSMPAPPIGVVVGVATPTISGFPQSGQLLTGATSSTNPAGSTVSYKWLRSDSAAGTYTAISSATNSTYRLTSSDVGKYIKFQVTISNNSNVANPSNSTATNIVIDSYTISYAAGGGSGSSPVSPTTVINGSTFIVPANTFTRDGYSFAGWSDGTNIYQAGDTYPSASGNVTLTATWAASSLTITYDSQSGSAISTGSTTTGGSIASSPGTPTRAGYTFAGWFIASTGGSAISFPYTHSQTSNFTLYAQWTGDALTPEIGEVLTTNDGFTVSQKNYDSSFTYSFTLTNGALATMDITNGLITVTNLSVGTSSTITITTTRSNYQTGTATATGNPTPYKTVIFDANGGAGSMNAQSARTTTTLSSNTFTRQYYEFAGWNLNSDGTGNTYSDGQTFDFSSDITLYAIWNPITFIVSYDSQGGSAVTNGSTTYNGKIASAPTQPTRSGHTFLGWFTAASGGSVITFEYTHNQTSNFTLYAQWSADTLTITYDSQGGSSISSGSTTTGGSIASSPGTPTRSGYTFLGWFTAASGGSAISFPYTHSQTANFTLYAQWSADTLTITYDSQEGSAISAGSTTAGGSIASSPGTPSRAGYTFNGWIVTASGGSAITFPYTHSQTASFTLYAQWSANTLNITYDANGGSTPAGGSATTTTDSTISTLATTSRSGYTFNGWFTQSSGGTQITTSAAHNQTASFTLYAQWSESSTANVITFSSISNQSYGATLDLSGYVSASSGLTVSLSSATTGVCTISTATVTAIAVGTCTITASQAGNATYSAANNVSRSFTVGKKSLVITIGNLSATVGSAVSDPTYSQTGLVIALGDLISTPTYKYQGKPGTYYPDSTTKPNKLGKYQIAAQPIALSSGLISNYEVTVVSGELSISGASTNQVGRISIKRSSGDKTTELLTGFNDATTSYSIYLEADISAVTATITRPAGSLITAQIKVNNSGWRRLSFASNVSASGNLPIPVATNTISILTTATDQSNRTFTITIFRDTKSVPSGATSAAPTPTVTPTPATQAVSAVKFYVNNATGIASGAAEVALSPSFSTGTLSYSAAFTNKQSATIMQINFTAAGVNLRLKVNSGPFRVIPALGSSNTIALNVGANTALLRVFSTDGTTVDYTFTLTRAAASP